MFPQPVCGPSVLVPGSSLMCIEDYVPGARSGEWTVDEKRCNRTYTNRLKLETGLFIGPAQVISLTGIKLGDTYRYPLYAGGATEVDTGSFVQSIRAETASEHSRDGVVQWAVTVEYGPFDVYHNLGVSNISDGTVDPTQRAYEIYWDSAKYVVTRHEDFDDPAKPYLNTVGDPLLDPPEYEESRPVLKLVRCEPSYDEGYANYFRDAVNLNVFLGCPPNTVKCRGITPDRDYDPDWGNFYRMTYEFEFRVDIAGKGFTHRLLNQGYRYLKGGAGKPVNAVDDKGETVTDAVTLDRNGDRLPAGADPYFLEFVGFPPVDFGGLNIPEDLFEAVDI